MSGRLYCGGMRCPGLAWPASRANPHPRTCLCQPQTWPGLAAVTMGRTPPSDRDPSVKREDPDPVGLGHQERIAQIAHDVAERHANGLYARGIFAGLTALARRSPELAQVAAAEAEAWAEVLGGAS